MNSSKSSLSSEALSVLLECERELEGRLVPLPDQPAETLAATVAALWHAAAGRPLSARAAVDTPFPYLDAAGISTFRSLVHRRLAGEPLAHLTGRQHFLGIELMVSPDALIPREETELLARVALGALRNIADSRGTALAIDVCTGSGNLALALASHERRARVHGSDLSREAVALAARNAEFLDLADRVSFVSGDLLDPFDTPEYRGCVDLVTCNPPYISSAKVETMATEIRSHEPRLAFDGGPFGIRILARLLDDAPRVLREGGLLAFEVGLGQGPGIVRRLKRHGGYTDVTEIADTGGDTRALLARWNPPEGRGASAI